MSLCTYMTGSRPFRSWVSGNRAFVSLNTTSSKRQLEKVNIAILPGQDFFVALFLWEGNDDTSRA